MSISSYLLMPLSKQSMSDPIKTKQLLNYLIDTNIINWEMPVEAWQYSCEEDDYDEKELNFKSLEHFYQLLDTLPMPELCFTLGFNRYNSEYKEADQASALPKINEFTNELIGYMDNFCQSNEIDPLLDLFGPMNIGLIALDSEDDIGEIRGIGFYIDGSMTYFMEEAGFLENFDSNLDIGKLMKKIAEIYGEEFSLIFRS